MSATVYTERIGRHIEENFIGGLRIRRSKVQINREIFVEIEEKVWRRGWRISKSGRA